MFSETFARAGSFEADAMLTVDVQRVAAFLNITPRRVQQLVKEGMPRESRGQYNPIKCGSWYVRYLQAAIDWQEVERLGARRRGMVNSEQNVYTDYA